MNNSNLHKIIHIDMDCFYAAIEIRDNPDLINKADKNNSDIIAAQIAISRNAEMVKLENLGWIPDIRPWR